MQTSLIKTLRLSGTLLLLSLAPSALASATFTTSTTWTCPVGLTSVQVQCWGGGGSGGSSTNNSCSGGGGGGGAYSAGTVAVTPGTIYDINVGAGGAATSALNSSPAAGVGGSGGNSYFSNTVSLATLVLAQGGSGGGNAIKNGNEGAGGVGGASASGVGTTAYSGGTGGSSKNTANGAGGGGSAGTAANGNTGGNSSSTAAGAGGVAVTGGGAGGVGSTGSGSGTAGSAPGGGGGGSRTSGSQRLGASGAAGEVVLTYTVQPAAYAIQASGSSTATTTAGVSENLTVTALDSTGAALVGMYGNVSLSFYGLSGSPSNQVATVSDVTGTAQPVTVSVGTPNTTLTFNNGVATVTGSANGVLEAYNASGVAATLNCSDGVATSASGTGAAGLSLTVIPAVSTQLGFTTAAQSIAHGSLSSTITVQRQDPFGNPNTTDAAVTVDLSSTSGTGAFWNTAGTATLTSVTINPGSSSAGFKYADSTLGTPAITAADAAGVLVSATQTETITLAALTWSASPANYNWNTTSADWTGGNGIFATGDSVIFNDTGAASSPINLVGTLNPVAVTVSASAKNYILSSTSGGAIGGTATLMKSGSATLTLATANSYTGATTVSGGVLDVKNSSALGAGVTTVSSGSALQVDGNGLAIGESVTLAGSGISGGGALLNLANANTLTGAITLTGNSQINSDAGTLSLSGSSISGTANLTVGGAGNVAITDAITTSGGLIMNGSGTLALSGDNNSYPGITLINSGVVSVADTDASEGSASDLGLVPTVVTTTNVILNGGHLLGNGTVALDPDRGLGIGPVTGSVGTNGLIDAASGQSFTVNGVIASSGNTGTDNLIVNSGVGNNGTVLLGGANTFTGSTVVSNGFLQILNTQALQYSTLNYNNQGGSLVFDPSITAATLGGLTGTQDLELTNLSSEAVALSLGTNNASTTYAGGIGDAGLGSSLTLSGTGTITLTGTNTYTGATTVNTGTLELSTGGVLGGSSLTVGTVAGAGTFLLNGGTISSGALDVGSVSGSPAAGTVTLDSGTATFTSTTIGANNNGGVITVNGGAIDLGAFNDKRDASVNGAASLNVGLVIAGGTVTADSVIVASGNSGGNLTMSNGSLTIGNASTSGGFEVGTGTSTTRGGFLTISGGTLTYDGSDGLLINNAADTVGTAAFSGGISTLTGITLNESGNTGGSANLTIGGSAVIYLGSVGLVENSGSASATINLNGGIIGAVADWSSSVPLSLNGTAFQTADASGDPFAITLSGTLSGGAGLTVSGGGSLTLGAADTYTGNTVINGGTLALASGASLASDNIVLAAGTTFDVTQAGGLTLNSGQSLKGLGTVAGAVTAASGAVIYPGSNTVAGTLTFTGGLTENGGVNNQFSLSSNPKGPNNDFINASGGLTLTGSNAIVIVGALASGGVYPLINYGGNLSGGIANLFVTGATGTLSNSPSAQTIYFVVLTSFRAPTNTTWLGNATANNWNTEAATNWLNNGTGLLDLFVPGDNNLFNNLGAKNPTVNIVGSVSPGSITVNTTSNYTFTGNGVIGGLAGLTVSNGTLTVLTTNTFTGPTILDGGVLVTPILGGSGTPSGIGAASSDPGNLIFNGGTLAYDGGTAYTDHGITLTNGGGTFDVAAGSVLTLDGAVTGGGTLAKSDTGTLVLGVANTYTNATDINGGVLQIDSAAAVSSAAITFSNGTLAYYPSGGITVANPFVFTAGTTNMLIVTSGSGGNPVSSGNWSGAGVLLVSNTYNPFTVNGVLDQFTGTILLATPNGAGFRFNSGGGNSSFGSTNATFDLGLNSAILTDRNGGTMNLGALQGGSGTFVEGQGSDSGTTVWSIGNNNLSTLFSGVIENNAANQVSAVTKVGTGTLTLAGVNTYTGPTVISSGGLALANNPTNGTDGSIADSASITLAAGTVLDVSGTSTGTLSLGASQSLTGPGLLRGSLDASGTVAPGGILTVTNIVTLESSATVTLNLNRASSPNSDRIAGSSSISYGGTLVVNNIGAALQAGDKFILFPSAAYPNPIGAFSAVTLPTLSGDLFWNTNELAVDGSISVEAPVPPSFSGVTVSGHDLVLQATGGTAGGPITVLGTTNLTLPLTKWTTVTTGSFDGNGNFSYTVSGALSSGLKQQFFIFENQ